MNLIRRILKQNTTKTRFMRLMKYRSFVSLSWPEALVLFSKSTKAILFKDRIRIKIRRTEKGSTSTNKISIYDSNRMAKSKFAKSQKIFSCSNTFHDWEYKIHKKEVFSNWLRKFWTWDGVFEVKCSYALWTALGFYFSRIFYWDFSLFSHIHEPFTKNMRMK